MGDVGSNFLGFTLSVISIMGMAKGYTILAIAAPIIILGIPVFDMIFAVSNCRSLRGHTFCANRKYAKNRTGRGCFP